MFFCCSECCMMSPSRSEKPKEIETITETQLKKHHQRRVLHSLLKTQKHYSSKKLDQNLPPTDPKSLLQKTRTNLFNSSPLTPNLLEQDVDDIRIHGLLRDSALSTATPWQHHQDPLKQWSPGQRSKPLADIPLYWLVHRDSCSGLLQSLYRWVDSGRFHPLVTSSHKAQSTGHCSPAVWSGQSTPP